MRKIASSSLRCATFLFTMTLLSTLSAGAATTFEQGNEKYRAGDFKAAAEFYAKAIQNGEDSAAAHYNLGNAQFRLGQKGRALASFERARLRTPRDQDVQWNISVLKSTFMDRLDIADEPILMFWAKKIADNISFEEAAFLLTSLCGLLFILSLLYFAAPVFSQNLRGILNLALLALVLSGAVFGWKTWEAHEPHAVVTDAEIFARYGPSGKETKAFLLHEGAEGRITDEVKDWVYLTLANKSSGWIPKKSCEIV